jgi:hypothetical protein
VGEMLGSASGKENLPATLALASEEILRGDHITSISSRIIS